MRLLNYFGKLQVQMQNSMFYITWFNVVMMVFTFWNTSGYALAVKFAPWFQFTHFVICLFVLLLLIMWLDTCVFYKRRLTYINNQTCNVAENPAMVELLKLSKQITRLEEEIKSLKGKENGVY